MCFLTLLIPHDNHEVYYSNTVYCHSIGGIAEIYSKIVFHLYSGIIENISASLYSFFIVDTWFLKLLKELIIKFLQ